MIGRQLVMGSLHGRDAAALVVDGVLTDLVVDPAGVVPFAPGAILRGRVDRLMKGQGGVFLRLPDGERGYLRDRSGLREGQDLLVQVSGAAEPGKAVPLSTRLMLRGRYAIVTPGAPGVNPSRSIRDDARREALSALGRAALADATPDPEDLGIILRSAAGAADDDAVGAELASLLELACRIREDRHGPPELLLDGPTPAETAWTDWSEPAPDAVLERADAFDESGVADAVDALLSPDVALRPGLAHVEPTRAITAIDVNTGADHSPAAALKANLALARDLPRQLRLRGLGGQVVIDFAPVPKRDRGTIDQAMRKAFRGEAAETVLIGWTAMGLYELTRKRDRVPLSRLIAPS